MLDWENGPAGVSVGLSFHMHAPWPILWRVQRKGTYLLPPVRAYGVSTSIHVSSVTVQTSLPSTVASVGELPISSKREGGEFGELRIMAMQVGVLMESLRSYWVGGLSGLGNTSHFYS